MGIEPQIILAGRRSVHNTTEPVLVMAPVMVALSVVVVTEDIYSVSVLTIDKIN